MNQDKECTIFNDINNLLDIHSDSKKQKIRFRVGNDNEFFIGGKKSTFVKKSFIGKHAIMKNIYQLTVLQAHWD